MCLNFMNDLMLEMKLQICAWVLDVKPHYNILHCIYVHLVALQWKTLPPEEIMKYIIRVKYEQPPPG